MKKLYIVRHAQKEDEQIGRDDYDRELSDEGIIDAQKMAEYFASKKLPVDLIVASPASRTKNNCWNIYKSIKIQ